MFSSIGNMANLMKQAASMRQQMQERQAELAKLTFNADAGGGLVKATVNGKLELVDISIDPQAVSDLELLEDLIKAAVVAANKKAQQAVQQSIADFATGLNIPGLQDLLGGGDSSNT